MTPEEHSETMDALKDHLVDQLLLPRDAPILWRVKATWANKGRTGDIDCIVSASTATEALRLAWGVEDDHDLRNVSIEWLGPEDCVIRAEDDDPTKP